MSNTTSSLNSTQRISQAQCVSSELDTSKGFLSRFKPSAAVIRQMEADVRGVSRDKIPNIVLG